MEVRVLSTAPHFVSRAKGALTGLAIWLCGRFTARSIVRGAIRSTGPGDAVACLERFRFNSRHAPTIEKAEEKALD